MNQFRHILAVLLGIVLLATLQQKATVLAQSRELNPQWALPQRVPGYAVDINPPILIADQEKRIHAFNSITLSPDQRVIAYSLWDGSWTTPKDIVIGRNGQQVQLLDVVFDSTDVAHLIYYEGNEQGAALFYTTAPAIVVERASAWSDPVLISDAAGPLSEGKLLVNDDDQLVAVFAGYESGRGMYAAYSADNGANWSDPTPLQLTYDDQKFPHVPEGSVSENGQFHITWAVAGISGNGDLVAYINFDPASQQWSELTIVARRYENGFEATRPNIISHEGKLILFYQQDISAEKSVATRWYVQSDDNGQTWGEPIRPFEHVGTYGAVALTTDSSGNLYAMTGGRTTTSDGEIHGLWLSKLESNGWSPLQAIWQGPRVVDEENVRGFDPSRPKIVVSQGNLLFATWSTDPGAGRNGVWYSYTTLPSPELPVRALLQPTEAAVATIEKPTPTVAQEDIKAITIPQVDINKRAQTQDVGFPVLLSGGTAFFIVVTVIFIQIRRRS